MRRGYIYSLACSVEMEMQGRGWCRRSLPVIDGHVALRVLLAPLRRNRMGIRGCRCLAELPVCDDGEEFDWALWGKIYGEVSAS